MGRNANIDLIKIVSIMGVCSLHFYLRFMWNDPTFRWEYLIFYAAGMAIPLFFMVNGFLLLKKERNKTYYLKKIVNIIKIVVSVNVFWYFLCVVRGMDHPNPFQESFFNLFLQQGFFSPFWFFGALIIIYTLLAIIPYKLFTPKNLLISIIVLALFQFAVNETNLVTCKDEKMFEIYIPQTFRIYNHLIYFLLGGFIALRDDKIKINKNACWGGGVFMYRNGNMEVQYHLWNDVG